MEIIRERTSTEHISYYRCYGTIGDVHFSFPCDSKGVVIPGTETAQANYAACDRGDVIHGKPMKYLGVERIANYHNEPAIGRCDVCNRKVTLDANTCTCDHCGTDYNWSGQRLAPREQWGEETGEHWSECL